MEPLYDGASCGRRGRRAAGRGDLRRRRLHRPHLRAPVGLHDRDARAGHLFKRNFGQHPAMHAGIARARGYDRGDDGRRPAERPRRHHASWSRRSTAAPTWPAAAGSPRVTRFVSRRCRRGDQRRCCARLTGAPISDFGCAFNAYRRDALEPVLHRIGRQKFTKALVCSTGAKVVEVEFTHQARADASRYGVTKLVKLALHVLTGFWPQMVQWVGAVLAIGGILTASVVGIWGVDVLDPPRQLPRAALLGGLVLFVLGLQGSWWRCSASTSSGSSGTWSEDRSTTSTASWADCGQQAILVTGGAGFISSNMIRYLLARHRPRGGDDGCPHLRGQPRQPGRRDRPRSAALHQGRHPRPRAMYRRARRRRRDRQRRRRVARLQVDRAGRRRVRDHQRGRHPGAARRRCASTRSSGSS